MNADFLLNSYKIELIEKKSMTYEGNRHSEANSDALRSA